MTDEAAQRIVDQLTRIADAMEQMAKIAAIEARRDAGMARADDREYLSRQREPAGRCGAADATEGGVRRRTKKNRG